MHDRRKSQRQSPKEYPVVYDRKTNRPIGGLANLSPEGAMLITPEKVKTGTVFTCRLDLIRPILDQTRVTFDAECRWCRKNIKANRWESGYLLTVSGVNAELVSYLTLSFKLGACGDSEVRDITTVELENRRNATRFDLKKPLPIFQQHHYLQLGELVDLSITGARLFTDRPIEKDSIINYRVLLDRKIFGQEYLLFDACCMWCRPVTDSNRYESGHVIVHISEQDAAIVLRLMMRHANLQESTKRFRVVP
jgi:hypothetical protein